MLYDAFMHPLIIWLAFVVGLVVGSFLNVVGHRFLTEESIVLPPSHCPHCKKGIKPYDNIPVVSYLLLGGQCRHCKTGISLMYPMIELATGLLFAAVVWMFGLSWQSLFLLFMVSNLMVIVITDLRESLIFTSNSLSLIPAGLIYSFLNLGHVDTTVWPMDLGFAVISIPHTFISSIIAIAGAYVFFEGCNLFSRMLIGEDGFGDGDTHLMMGVGAFFGWKFSLLSLVLGFFLQTILAIPMLVFQWIQEKRYVSLISGGVATAFSIIPIFVMTMPIEHGMRTTFTVVCIVITLIALVVFMRQIRESKSFNFMPLGPALVLGTLITLFWGEPVLKLLTQFFWL